MLKGLLLFHRNSIGCRVPSCLRQAHLFAPSSVTHNAGIGDKNQFQVLTAGQEKFEQTPNSSEQEVFGFWAKILGNTALALRIWSSHS